MDILARAQAHLRQLAPHVAERAMAQIMQGLVEELERERKKKRGEAKLNNEAEITLALGAFFHAAKLANGSRVGEPSTSASIFEAREFIREAKDFLKDACK